MTSQHNAAGEVRAAGGVFVRRGEAGVTEVLLVHRPKYDDWTVPKGKAEAGETDEQCARREVEEETGLRGQLGRELATIRYVDRLGRAKAVRYWAMEVVEGSFIASDEVDEVAWLSLPDARRRLSYPRDHELLDAVAAPPEVTS